MVSRGTIADNTQPVTAEAEAKGNATVTAGYRYTLSGVTKEADANIAVSSATLQVDRATDPGNTDSSYAALCTPGTASHSPGDCTLQETIDVSVSSSQDQQISIDRLKFTAAATGQTLLALDGTYTVEVNP